MFDGELAVTPPLDEAQLKRIPRRRGVVLLSADSQPILLITAADIRARIRTRLDRPPDDVRKKSADLREVTTRISWKLAASAFEADLCLLELGAALWPERLGDFVPWKAPWFVHVDLLERLPYFVCGRGQAASGRSLGPFFRKRDAGRFISAVEDAFDLCRDYRRLRRGPHAQRCSYGQMGRCLCPCDGTISPPDYARAVERAADFAAGDRRALRGRLRAEMKAAADRLDFERAGSAKARLERLGEFGRPAYAHARAIGEFRFIVVQRGRGRKHVRAFLVDRGAIGAAAAPDYPPDEARLEAFLRDARLYMGSPHAGDDACPLRMGLVSGYLFSGPRRRGLIVRWRGDLSAAELVGRIRRGAEMLGLGADKPVPSP